MEKDLPDVQTTESMQGDRLHDYYAHPEYVREWLTPAEQDLLRTIDQLTDEIFDVIGLQGDFVEHREKYVGNELIGGHPDLMRVYGKQTSVIIDAKFGWAPVEKADVNLQTRVYAVLAPTDDVYVAIAQPRVFEDRITIAKYSVESKIAARSQIAKILEKTEDPNAPLVAGEAQCRYCKARATCPALRDAIAIPINLDLRPDYLPDWSKTKILAAVEARLAQADDHQMAALHTACGLAKLVNDPVNDEIRRRIEAGGMEGWKVAKEIEVRSITSALRAIPRLVLGRIATRERLLELCELPPGRVETLHRQLNKVTAKTAKDDINRILEPVIKRETRKGRIIRP